MVRRSTRPPPAISADVDERRTLSEVVGDPLVADVDYDEGEIVSDVFVIVRTIHPDRDTPTICYTATEGLRDDAQRIGVLTICLDRIRDVVRRNWSDDE